MDRMGWLALAGCNTSLYDLDLMFTEIWGSGEWLLAAGCGLINMHHMWKLSQLSVGPFGSQGIKCALKMC